MFVPTSNVRPRHRSRVKDPGEFVQRRGIEAWNQASAAPICGITWRALELTGLLTATTSGEPRSPGSKMEET
jgi:hypothetical protein